VKYTGLAEASTTTMEFGHPEDGRLKVPPYLCSGGISLLQLQNHHKDMDRVFLRYFGKELAGYTTTHPI
jgi:hypothetical protein